jgi:drug/metabolite transporter (DMT)-like permease
MSTLTQLPEQQTQGHSLRIGVSFGLVYFFWGSTYLAIQIAVQHFPAPVLGSIRFLIGGIPALAWCALTGKKIAISRRDALKLAVIGVLLLTTGNVVLAWTEETLNSGLAAMIVAIVPIWVALIEMGIGGDRLNRRGWMGLLLGIAGLVVLTWPDLTSGTPIGRRDLLVSIVVMLAALSWALGSVFSRRFKVGIHPFAATGWEMTFAGLVNTVIAAVTGGFHRADWSRPGWLAVAYLVVFGSWVGFTAYIWLLEHVPTPKVATYAYINPIVAVFLGWLLHHEQVNWSMFLGMIVIVAAVALVTSSKLRTKTTECPAPAECGIP